MKKFLVVEDDAAIRQGLIDTLESEGYAMRSAANGEEALTLLKAEAFDLVILDIMMPERNGYDVCRELRRFDQQVPVLMLTAKSEEIDKVLGLELGADDYMTKPFGVRELLARVHALLRRAHADSAVVSNEDFQIGPLTVSAKKLTGTLGEKKLDFTAREIALLRFFSEHPDDVLSRDQLLNHAWGVNYYGTTRTLDQHIAQLRKKIEPDRKEPTYIQTVHGVGYRYSPSDA